LSRRKEGRRLPEGSLAAALLVAAHAVAEVAQGTALPAALQSAANGCAPQTRAAAQDLSYRAMRMLGSADAVLRMLANRAPQPALLAALLHCALALLLDPAKPYEAHTVVDQAVEACGVEPTIVHARGMVNAVLRRALREMEQLLPKLQAQPVARWNYPQWWIDQLRAAWPEQWQGILEAGNAAPPLTLRVNQRRCDVQAYLAGLSSAGLAGTVLGPAAVRVSPPQPVQNLPGFSEGLVSVQDAAAQLAAPLLDLAPGQRVLDACAAPGGKTGHILEIASVELTALDVDGQRLARVRENLERLGLSATLLQGNAAEQGWWDGKPYDRILADVPCTASGIVRRHPDIRWLRRPADAARLAGVSAAILDNLWRMLAPGGKLLLVTCSLWPRESEEQALAFAQRNGALRLPAPGQLLPEANSQQDHDGLFYALFQKPAS
jgi:16S rRNA (cytosine967-C5)-methyltransferase